MMSAWTQWTWPGMAYNANRSNNFELQHRSRFTYPQSSCIATSLRFPTLQTQYAIVLFVRPALLYKTGHSRGALQRHTVCDLGRQSAKHVLLWRWLYRASWREVFVRVWTGFLVIIPLKINRFGQNPRYRLSGDHSGYHTKILIKSPHRYIKLMLTNWSEDWIFIKDNYTHTHTHTHV